MYGIDQLVGQCTIFKYPVSIRNGHGGLSRLFIRQEYMYNLKNPKVLRSIKK